MNRFLARVTPLVGVILAIALLVVPTVAASAEVSHPKVESAVARAGATIAGESPVTFHAFNQMTPEERAALTPLTSEQLAEVKGGQFAFVLRGGLMLIFSTGNGWVQLTQIKRAGDNTVGSVTFT
jgi:hypothetical protein